MSENLAPVLVVGGRTTGLMMAAELARYDVPVRIIDKSPGIDPHSRATYLHSRTLEILHGLGLAQEIYAKGQPMKAVQLYANGKQVASWAEPPVDSPFPWGAAYAQNKTEENLERHLQRLGVDVERSTELLSLEQSAEGVEATIKLRDGSEQKIHTPWLIGCDGAHSVTRKLIGESFPGEVDPIPYLGADVIVEGDIKPEIAYLCLHDEGDVFIYLLDDGRRQVLATLPKNSPRTEPPTLEEMQRLLDERGFGNLRLVDPRCLTIYRSNYRLTPHYRRDRVFLAGDAAHIHSVVGGQGMNTGIQDAHNLGWKLAQVIRGFAPSWWLDTYDAERRGIAADVIAWTKQATEQLTLFPELTTAERERVFEQMVVPDSEQLKLREHQEEIDLDYRSSDLCVGRSVGMEGRGLHAGARCPDAGPVVVGGKTSTFIKTLGRPSYHLLLFSRPTDDDSDVVAAAREALEEHGSRLKVLVVGSSDTAKRLPEGAELIEDPENALRTRYDGDNVRLYLVRPDGYVAYQSQRIDSLHEYWNRVLAETSQRAVEP